MTGHAFPKEWQRARWWRLVTKQGNDHLPTTPVYTEVSRCNTAGDAVRRTFALDQTLQMANGQTMDYRLIILTSTARWPVLSVLCWRVQPAGSEAWVQTNRRRRGTGAAPAQSARADGHVGMPRWKLPLVAKDFIALMRQNQHQVQLFDGVPRMLRDLAEADLQLAIVSSNAGTTFAGVLGRMLPRCSQSYECGMSIFGKPSRLNGVLHKLAVPAVASSLRRRPDYRCRGSAHRRGCVCGGRLGLWHDQITARTPTRS